MNNEVLMDKCNGKRQLGRPEKKQEHIIKVNFDELVDLQAREFGFLYPAMLNVFLFSKMSRLALGLRQPLIKRVPEYFHGNKAAGT